MLLLISIIILFDVTQTEEDKQKYNKDYIGLLQTIRGKQGPLLVNKDRGTLNIHIIMNYGQTKYSRILPGKELFTT